MVRGTLAADSSWHHECDRQALADFCVISFYRTHLYFSKEKSHKNPKECICFADIRDALLLEIF